MDTNPASFNFGSLFSSLNLGSMGQMILSTLLIAGIVLLAGGAFFLWYWKTKGKGSAKGKKTAHILWWVGVENRMEPGILEEVEEITMPNSSLSLFYVKKRDTWLPRFTRAIRKDLYYVMKRTDGELMNFVIMDVTKTGAAKIGYDHSDMRWAAENAREYVKRNYRDKSLKWWQVYKGPITTGIYIFIITFSLVILMIMAGKVFGQIGTQLSGLLDGINKAIQQLGQCSASGLKPGA